MKRIIKSLIFLSIGILCGCEETENFLSYGEGMGQISELPFELTCQYVGEASTPDSIGFHVRCQNIPWHFTDYAEWMHITPTRGNESVVAKYKTDDNNSPYFRLATFYFSAQDTAKWHVIQEYYAWQNGSNPYLYLDMDGMDANSRYGEITVSGQANTISIPIRTNMTDIKIEFVETKTNVCATISNGNLIVNVPENTTLSENNSWIALQGTYSYMDENSEDHWEVRGFELKVTQLMANITTSAEELKFGKDKSTTKIKIKSDLPWTASTAQTWISLDKVEGQVGESELSISVTDNISATSRMGSIYFHMGEQEVRIPVIQNGCQFIVVDGITDGTMKVSDAVSSGTITIETDFPQWKIASAPEWITFTPSEGGAGRHTLTYSVSDNPNTTSRTGNVKFEAEGIRLDCTISVEQAGKSFGDFTNVIQFENTASTSSINIPTNGTWSASTDADWITLSPTTGMGNQPLSISVSDNTSDDERLGVVKVTVGQTTKLFTVIQKGLYFTIDQTTLNPFASKGGTIALNISTNQSWTAEVEGHSDWLTLSATSGTGSAVLKITASDNPTLDDRTETVILTRENKQSIRLIVRQLGRYLKLSSQTCDFFYKGGTAEPVIVYTDGSWTAESADIYSWLTMQVENGDSSSKIILTAQPNESETTRTATILLYLNNLAGENSKVKVTELKVTQYGVGTHFTLANYDEDKSLEIEYKEKVGIIILGWGNDKDYDGTSTSVNVSTGGWSEDASYE